MTKLHVTKMHGCWNIYGVIEDLQGELEKHLGGYDKLAAAISAYIRSDGLLVIQHGNKTKYRMRIFNPDGFEAEMCGNGTRIIAKYIYDNGMINENELESPLEVYDGSNIVTPRINLNSEGEFESATVSMGKGKMLGINPVTILNKTFLGYKVDVGNPHYVIFDESASEHMAKEYGPFIENHHDFQPYRTNVEFARIICSNWIDLFPWERGAGYTQACGSGACAVVTAARKVHGTESDVDVVLPGGTLYISVKDDDSIEKTGPAEYHPEESEYTIPDVEIFLAKQQRPEKETNAMENKNP